MYIRNNMAEQILDDVIELRSAYNKIPGMRYKLQPCPDKRGKWPDCVRPVDANGDMILSEDDKKKYSKGVTFIPQNAVIEVYHGKTFHLSEDSERAQWEAIRNSNIIAKDRYEKDRTGVSVIDGPKTREDRYGNPHGSFGLAELYIVRPGKVAESRNTLRRRKHEAEQFVLNDSQEHRILICKLFGKDMSNSYASDVEEFLMVKAEKDPDTIIKYYSTNAAKSRLLLITALEKNVVVKREDGMYYGDIKLGVSMDYVCDLLEKNEELYANIKKETFPELEKTKK